MISIMSDSHQREKEIFSAAQELGSLEEQRAFVKGACGSDDSLRHAVEGLLEAYAEAEGFIPQRLAESPGVTGNAYDEKPGTVIGRYKLLEKIGEGGMGVVYMAEQEEPVRRRVALKIIKLGMDTQQVVARFEAERQALALMDHPNIAKVLDGGATDTGRPYFVMELVQGVPITEFCDKNRLSAEERVKLLIPVCQAIQSAHQKGIIHRDLKPTNILVTLNAGVPHPMVIDFGVAKAISQRLTDKTVFTNFATMIGTPAYMSPEQAEMSRLDVDTRADIYGLGVLLYELLTGTTPFPEKRLRSVSYNEMQRIIMEEEPERPSTRLRLKASTPSPVTSHYSLSTNVSPLSTDLDWIVMKCLEKDRARRYETVNGLAADLKRHLDNEPVVARPPSTAYRFQKAIRRNKIAFTAGAAIAVALVVGIGISMWQAVLANRAKTLANKRLADSEANATLATQRLADSEAISKFLTEVFQSPDPARDGRTITVAETLSNATKKLETDLTNQPARRANLQTTIGTTYYALGLYGDAMALQEKVRDYYLAASGPKHPDTLLAMHNLAKSYDVAGRPDEALKLEEQVLPLLRKVRGPEDPDTLKSMNSLAIYYGDVGRPDEALKLREQVLPLFRKVLGLENTYTLHAMNNLALSYHDAGRRDEALKMREQVLALRRKVNGPEDPDTLKSMSNLAISYDDAGRPDEALILREQVLALSRKVLGPEHPVTRVMMNTLADSYSGAGRYTEATALLEESCRLLPKDTDSSLTLAVWQTWFGQDTDYEATRYRLVQQADGTDDPFTAERAAKVACLRPTTNAALLGAALVLAQRCVELGKSKNSEWLPCDQLTLGLAEYRNGQYAAAEQTLFTAEQTAGDLHDASVDIQHEIQGTARLFRAMSLFRRDKPEEARKLFSQAEAEMPPSPKDESKPHVDGKSVDRDLLVMWLAYKEAKALIEGPTAP
jgi:eukaryotic-like serine/threonine-protein kinase